jgi:hypothetical protein
MNRKLLSIVVAFAFPALATVANAQNSGGPDANDSAAPQENKPAPKPRIRWPKLQKLPDQYRARDTDKDGQIGMYEWPRSDYATFRKLDLNHDGFLTPQELTRGPSSKPTAPAAAVAAPPPAAEGASSTAATGSAPAPAAPAAASPATAAGSDAERQWDVLDKDKDGKVTEEEWGKSLFTRPKFRDAGVAVSFPLARDEFLRLYQQVVTSSAK